jgi:dynein heavy chain
VKIQKTINETRKNYYPVAFRVSKLFFVVADLCNIEPMYQYSLEWYQRIYITAIEEAEKSQIITERVHNLIEMFTELLYDNVCRSLYVKDKLLFSLLMLIKILQGDDLLDN